MMLRILSGMQSAAGDDSNWEELFLSAIAIRKIEARAVEGASSEHGASGQWMGLQRDCRAAKKD